MKYIFYLDQREENMYLNYFIYTLKNWRVQPGSAHLQAAVRPAALRG